jgi:hypothetical protein
MKLFGVKKKNCLPIHKMIDIYAFAITIFEMINTEKTWELSTVREFRDYVLSGGRPKISPTLASRAAESEDTKFILDLAKNCWHQEPESRPDINDILSRFEKTEITNTMK